VFIENDVIIGDRVTIKCGVQLWDGLRVEDDVFIGPNATFTNDPYPRSKVYPKEFLKTTIRRNASIGANATILPGITVGEGAMVGAGSVVTANVPSRVLVHGNPARVISFLDAEMIDASTLDKMHGKKQLLPGVELWPMQTFSDRRGSLVVSEFARDLPFVPQRFHAIFGADNGQLRGDHAHYRCIQFNMLLSGSLTFLADNGKTRRAVNLLPGDAALVAPGTWCGFAGFNPETVIGVLSSEPYDPADYIRDYREFREKFGVDAALGR
jgi:UDP-3-O-[3-hydroxymyristoyl] glucosamine N-acyltransferase